MAVLVLVVVMQGANYGPQVSSCPGDDQQPPLTGNDHGLCPRPCQCPTPSPSPSSNPGCNHQVLLKYMPDTRARCCTHATPPAWAASAQHLLWTHLSDGSRCSASGPHDRPTRFDPTGPSGHGRMVGPVGQNRGISDLPLPVPKSRKNECTTHHVP